MKSLLLTYLSILMMVGCASEPLMVMESYSKDDLKNQSEQLETLQEIRDDLKSILSVQEKVANLTPHDPQPQESAQEIPEPKQEPMASTQDGCICPDCSCTDCDCSGGRCVCPDCDKVTEALATETPQADDWRICKFSATWCGPCKVYPVSRLNVPHYEVDVSDKKKWSRFGITMIPAFDITKNGMTVYRYRPNNRNPYPPTPEQINAKVDELKSGFSIPSPVLPATKRVIREKIPGTGWNEGRSACGNPRCSMCYSQYRMREVTLSQPTPTEAGQEPTPDEEITRALELLDLDSSDKLVDFGCGDARVLIQAARTYGCDGIGVEIDPKTAQIARKRIDEAGLGNSIEIVVGDVRGFDAVKYGATKGYVYLYDDLIAEITDRLDPLSIVVSPFHPINGLETQQVDNIYVYKRSYSKTKIAWNPTGLRSLSVDVPPQVRQAIQDPDSIWLENEDPLQWQLKTDGSLMSVYRVGYNMALNKHLTETGSPNNENPWRHSGGFDDCDVSIIKMYNVPGKIRIRKQKTEVPGFRANALSTAKWLGQYPDRTVAAEFIKDNKTNSVVALRYRLKSDDNWITEQIDLGPMPANYAKVDNCVDCHEDITKHANELDDTQEWYTTVRGLEPGGPFNFPLVKSLGNGMDGKGTINPDIAHLLHWEN